MTQVAFVGMGHLGCVMAVVTANATDQPVICYDPDPAMLRSDQDYGEPGLLTMMQANAKLLKWTANAAELSRAEIIYVTVDMVRYDVRLLTELYELISSIAKIMDTGYARLVLMSTVPPGFTRTLGSVIPPHKVYYRLDNLILGQGINRAGAPQGIIIGTNAEEDTRYSALHAQLRKVWPNTLIRYTPYENAELAKIAINCYLASAVTMSNALAEITDKIPGADWQVVSELVRGDTRVGTYTKPGLGIGGGHLMRDVKCARVIAESTPALFVPSLVMANITDYGSWYLNDWIEARLRHLKGPTNRVGVWGLTYKPGTSSLVDSASIRLLDRYIRVPIQVLVHDPVASLLATNDFGKNVIRVDTPLAAAMHADVLLIMTPWPTYATVPLPELGRVMAKRVVIDPYRVHDAQVMRKMGFEYHTMGLGPDVAKTDVHPAQAEVTSSNQGASASQAG